MNRHNEIKNAYKKLGGDETFYDGMVTCSTLSGKAVCKAVWNMDKRKNDRYLQLALSGIPHNFSGKMLEVPVGTGVLTMPVYETLPNADITCVDYSSNMMERAVRQAKKRQVKNPAASNGASNLKRRKGRGICPSRQSPNVCKQPLGSLLAEIENIRFMQGDVGKLPFENDSFDLAVSLNGFHAFPDKEAAYSEIFRVLKPDGIFCGCFYIKGENKRTDWFIEKIYTPKGYFTPPYETAKSLQKRLEGMYLKAEVKTVEGMAVFRCRKSGK